MGELTQSPIIPILEAAFSVVFFLLVWLRKDSNYYYPLTMMLAPAVIDYLSSLIGGAAEYPVYYLSLAGLAIMMMVKMFDFKHDFTAKAFFVLTFVCVILAVITTHIQLSDDGSDATMLGLVFILCWWAMDGLVIWMAFNGKFTRNRAEFS